MGLHFPLGPSPRPTPPSSRRPPLRDRRDAQAPPTGETKRATLGSILLERQVITDDQLNAAIEQQRRTGRRIGQVLIDMGATTQDAVLGALSVQLGMPGMRVNAYTVDTEALAALPEKVARARPSAVIGRR